jgi:hypothetical protein
LEKPFHPIKVISELAPEVFKELIKRTNLSELDPEVFEELIKRTNLSKSDPQILSARL